MSLDTFLDQYFEKKCSIYSSHHEVLCDVEKAVKELVWKILTKGLAQKVKDIVKPSRSERTILFGGTFRDILPVSDLIPIGSYYEGTRLGNPFEYDFMFVVDVAVEVFSGCGPGYVNVKYPSDRNWKDLLPDRILWSGTDQEEYPSLLPIFSILFEVLTKDDNIMSQEEKTIQTSSGVLKAMHSEGGLHMAALWINPEKEENVVSVDLRPAFRCPQQELEKQELRGSLPQNLYKFVKEHDIYIVPKHCITPSCSRCFLVSYATCEKNFMQNLDEHHRKCYLILKSMVSPKDTYEDPLTEVTTYHVKTCLFYHVYEAYPQRCENVSTEQCALHILDMLICSFKKMKLSTFFQRDLCLFESGSYSNYNIDFIFHTGSELKHILDINLDDKDTIIHTLMYLASIKLTQEFLLMIHDLLLYVRSRTSTEDSWYRHFHEAIEDLHYALEYHFTGTLATSVERNKWFPCLKSHTSDLHVPMVWVLKTAMCRNLNMNDFSFAIKFPVQVIKIESSKTEKCEGNLKDFISVVESSRFSIAGNDSCQIYYHGY